MQFDIKYAYFNFLQSINHKSLHDSSLSEGGDYDAPEPNDMDANKEDDEDK